MEECGNKNREDSEVGTKRGIERIPGDKGIKWRKKTKGEIEERAKR